MSLLEANWRIKNVNYSIYWRVHRRTIEGDGNLYISEISVFFLQDRAQNSSFQTVYKVISINLYCSDFNYTL